MTPRFLWTQKTAQNLARSNQLNGSLASLLPYIHFEQDSNRQYFVKGASQFMNQ
jgi:hypothetical protein